MSEAWYEHFYTGDFIEAVGFAAPEQTALEVDFVKKVLKCPAGARILDLCCGYGRHAFELAKSGEYRVIGQDLSTDYLRIAKKKFAGPNVEYIRGDMREIPFENEFDGVIDLFTSFGFFDSDGENERVLAAVHRALKPDGLFLLDYENKFYFVYHDVFLKRRYWEQIDGRFYLYENRYDPFLEREIMDVRIFENGEVKRSGGYNIRLYGYPEIEKMLSRNGFTIRQTWGDYRGNPYSTHSPRLILLSQKIR
jgi:SAM-dependent methyltransferase